ncbi:hypothetical protein [Paenibacillus elgii]|nr:hypothetical protein [Paenibacillus elgii]
MNKKIISNESPPSTPKSKKEKGVFVNIIGTKTNHCFFVNS